MRGGEWAGVARSLRPMNGDRSSGHATARVRVRRVISSTPRQCRSDDKAYERRGSCVCTRLCVTSAYRARCTLGVTVTTLYRVGKVPEILSMAILYRVREIHHSRTPSLTKSAMRRGRRRRRILQNHLYACTGILRGHISRSSHDA